MSIFDNHNSLPSLSPIQSPSNQSPKTPSNDDSILFQMSFPKIAQHIDVENEITNFVKDLDDHEGKEECIFTTKLSKHLEEYDEEYDEDKDPKNLLFIPQKSRDWDGVATTLDDKEDNASSLEMKYYVVNETTKQKSGIPISLLGAHLEKKEPLYPSFVGSRNSVSMVRTNKGEHFKTLQRSPNRRTSMEITYPTFSPQVLEVIRALEEHKKKAEKDSNYMDARATTQHLNGVKILEDNKKKIAMLDRHGKEREELEREYKEEILERNRLWKEKLHEFHKVVVEHATKLKRQQIDVLQAFRQRMAAKIPTKPQWSCELLKHRKVQTVLGKQGKYLEADEVKYIADRMEHIELEATLVQYATKVTIKEQALRMKQQNEMEVLLQRTAQGRDEFRKMRNLDLDRCSQKHTNIVRELQNFQKQEHMRFEQIFKKRVIEFKRNGGSLQLLSKTLSGIGSLMLPTIPNSLEGDEVVSSYGSDSHHSS